MSEKTEGQRDMGIVVMVALFVLALLIMIASQGCSTIKGFTNDAAWMMNKVDQSIVQPE